MRPESASKSTAQHAQQKTPDLRSYCAHFQGLAATSNPGKPHWRPKKPEKTLTVREALFRRESAMLSMHG
jgi:hypothetical protein